MHELPLADGSISEVEARGPRVSVRRPPDLARLLLAVVNAPRFGPVCTPPPLTSCYCHSRGKLAGEDYASRPSASTVDRLSLFRIWRFDLVATNQNVLVAE